MPPKRNQLSYAQRIDRVLLHLGQHLDENLCLDHLAEVACFSRFHFHRIYRGITGETVAATIRRLRLNRAATQLVAGRPGIAKIARQAGYGSTEAFSRAFQQDYGIPPSSYRTERRTTLLMPPPSPEVHAMYDVTIETLAPLSVIGIDHRGPYSEIGTSFGRLAAWAAGHGAMGPETRMFGIYYDDPEAVPPEELRACACMLLPPHAVPEGPVRRETLAGGRHASIVHKGPYAELEMAYRWLFTQWLPQSGEEVAEAPCFEEYLNDCRTLPPAEWLTRIHLPLKGD